MIAELEVRPRELQLWHVTRHTALLWILDSFSRLAFCRRDTLGTSHRNRAGLRLLPDADRGTPDS